MESAIQYLTDIAGRKRRVAVVGDMLELGRHAEALHREVGRCVAELAPDCLFAVGADAQRNLADEAVKAGFPVSRVVCFTDALGAAPAVKAFVKPGDYLLLKASRGMRLERILDELRV